MALKEKRILKIYYITPVLILFLLNNACFSKEFESQFNFKFNLPEGYEIFNKNNLYDVYNHSNKDPLVKAQINLAKKRLENQKIELLYTVAFKNVKTVEVALFFHLPYVHRKPVSSTTSKRNLVLWFTKIHRKRAKQILQ